MKINLTDELFSPKLCDENPSSLFIYGDNLEKHGNAGQACIRHCHNSHGIPTKRKPATDADAYYSDNDLESNEAAILTEINSIWSYARANYRAIIFPKAGIGTGLAKLKEKAPLTWDFLCAALKKYFGLNNETGEKL